MVDPVYNRSSVSNVVYGNNTAKTQTSTISQTSANKENITASQENHDDANTAKLARLKEQVQNGSYQLLSPSELAKSFVESEFS